MGALQALRRRLASRLGQGATVRRPGAAARRTDGVDRGRKTLVGHRRYRRGRRGEALLLAADRGFDQWDSDTAHRTAGRHAAALRLRVRAVLRQTKSLSVLCLDPV